MTDRTGRIYTLQNNEDCNLGLDSLSTGFGHLYVGDVDARRPEVLGEAGGTQARTLARREREVHHEEGGVPALRFGCVMLVFFLL